LTIFCHIYKIALVTFEYDSEILFLPTKPPTDYLQKWAELIKINEQQYKNTTLLQSKVEQSRWKSAEKLNQLVFNQRVCSFLAH